MASMRASSVLLVVALACLLGGAAADRNLHAVVQAPDTCSSGIYSVGNEDPTVCGDGTYYCKYDSGVLPGFQSCTSNGKTISLALAGTPGAIAWSISPTGFAVTVAIVKAGNGYCSNPYDPAVTSGTVATPAKASDGTNRGLSHFSICWKPTTSDPPPPADCFKCPANYKVACIPAVDPEKCT